MVGVAVIASGVMSGVNNLHCVDRSPVPGSPVPGSPGQGSPGPGSPGPGSPGITSIQLSLQIGDNSIGFNWILIYQYNSSTILTMNKSFES